MLSRHPQIYKLMSTWTYELMNVWLSWLWTSPLSGQNNDKKLLRIIYKGIRLWFRKGISNTIPLRAKYFLLGFDPFFWQNSASISMFIRIHFYKSSHSTNTIRFLLYTVNYSYKFPCAIRLLTKVVPVSFCLFQEDQINYKLCWNTSLPLDYVITLNSPSKINQRSYTWEPFSS